MGYSRGGIPFGIVPFDRDFRMAPINAGVPVLDQDINLMQHILSLSNALTAGAYLTCGWISPINAFFNLGVNSFEMPLSFLHCTHRRVTVGDTGAIGTNIINVPTTMLWFRLTSLKSNFIWH